MDFVVIPKNKRLSRRCALDTSILVFRNFCSMISGDDWQSALDGESPAPTLSIQDIQLGHAVVMVALFSSQRAFCGPPGEESRRKRILFVSRNQRKEKDIGHQYQIKNRKHEPVLFCLQYVSKKKAGKGIHVMGW